MPNWKTRTVTTTTIEVDGIEVELETPPEDGTEVKFVQQGDKLVVAYRTHDSDCGNPLAEQDGSGMIHWHPRAKYGRTCGDNYHGLLNIDQYGCKVIDDDKLQDAWHDRVMALPLELFQAVIDVGEDFVVDAEKLRELLADETTDYYSTYLQCKDAWGLDSSDMTQIDDEVDAIDKALAWNYEAEYEKCWKGPEKGVVLLDCYEHSGISLSISGSGTQCRCDTSSGAAVWAPDQCAMDEIDRRAAVYQWGWIEHDSAWPRANRKWTAYVDHPEGMQLGVYSEWHKAFIDLELHGKSLIAELPDEQLALGVQRAAEEICRSALEQYNAWADGDCWTVWSQRFQLIDEQWVEVDDDGADCCGGYVGSESAEEEMQERLHFNHWPEKVAA